MNRMIAFFVYFLIILGFSYTSVSSVMAESSRCTGYCSTYACISGYQPDNSSAAKRDCLDRIGPSASCCVSDGTSLEPTKIDCSNVGGDFGVGILAVPACAFQEIPRVISVLYDLALVFVTILAVFFYILGGWTYTVSRDNAEALERARLILLWTTVAVVTVWGSYAVMKYFVATEFINTGIFG